MHFIFDYCQENLKKLPSRVLRYTRKPASRLNDVIKRQNFEKLGAKIPGL